MGALKRSPKVIASRNEHRLFTPGNIPDAAALYLTRSFDHIVQKSGIDFERELRIANEMTLNPRKFLRTPLNVICDKQELLAGRNFHHRSAATSKKKIALAEFETYLMAASNTRRSFDSAMLIADELFTNASKNSWRDALLSDGPADVAGEIELFGHATTDRLVVGCRDSFGKLEITDLLKKIDACISAGVANSIHRGPGGAGIGSYLVFEAADSYYVATSRGRATVVCATLRIGSRAAMDERPKHIHLIDLDEEG